VVPEFTPDLMAILGRLGTCDLVTGGDLARYALPDSRPRPPENGGRARGLRALNNPRGAQVHAELRGAAGQRNQADHERAWGPGCPGSRSFSFHLLSLSHTHTLSLSLSLSHSLSLCSLSLSLYLSLSLLPLLAPSPGAAGITPKEGKRQLEPQAGKPPPPPPPVQSGHVSSIPPY
jgi:hypothetical protein